MKSLSLWLVLVIFIYIPRTECTKKRNGISSHNIWKGGKHSEKRKIHDKAGDKRGIVPEYLQGNDYEEGGVPSSFPSRDMRGTGLDVQSAQPTTMEEEDFTKDLRYDNGDMPADIYATGVAPTGQQERYNLSTLDKIDELSTQNLFNKFMGENVAELPKTSVIMTPSVPPSPFHQHRQHSSTWKQRKAGGNRLQRLRPSSGVNPHRLTHKKYRAKVENNIDDVIQATANEDLPNQVPSHPTIVDSEDLSPRNGSCFYDFDPSHKMTKMCVIKVDSISTPVSNENDTDNHTSIEGTKQPSDITFIKKMNVSGNSVNITSVENTTQLVNESSSDKIGVKPISLKKTGNDKENIYAINISHSTPDGNDFMTISYHFNRDKQQANFSNISIHSNLGNILSDAIMNSLAERLSNTNGYIGVGNDSYDSVNLNATTLNDVISSFARKTNMSKNTNNTTDEGILYFAKTNSSEGKNNFSQNVKVNDEKNETFYENDNKTSNISLLSKSTNKTKVLNKIPIENVTLLTPNATHSANNSTNLDTFLNILSLNEALSKLINKEKHNPQAFRPESMELMRSILSSMNAFYSDFKTRAFGNKTRLTQAVVEAKQGKSLTNESSPSLANQTNKVAKNELPTNSIINATSSVKSIPADLTKAGLEKFPRENITDLPILNDEFLQLHDDFLHEDDWHSIEDGYADASKKNTLFPKSSTENASHIYSESNESKENSSEYSLSDLERNNIEVLANMSLTLKDNPMGNVIQKSLLRRKSNFNESSNSNASRDFDPIDDEVKSNDENAVGEDEFLDKLFSSDTKDNNTANIDTLVATMHDSLFKLYAKVKNNTMV